MQEETDRSTCVKLLRKIMAVDLCLRRYQENVQKKSDSVFESPTRGQARVLSLLQIQPQIETRDLGFVLGIRQQSLNELLQKLEARGFIERKPSERDRRVMVICLTEKGKDTRIPTLDPEPVFAGMDESDCGTLDSLLDRMLANLAPLVSIEPGKDLIARGARLKELLGEEKFRELLERQFGGEIFGCVSCEEERGEKKS